MDLKLIERFLHAMVPPAGHPAVHTAFECMRAEPMTAVPTLGMMIGRLQHKLYSLDETEQVAAAHQVLTGIMIAWSSETPTLKKYIIDDFLERSALMQGANIINFWDKKAAK